MGNVIFDSLLRERTDLFRSAFAAVATEVFYDPGLKRLRHSGEYGMYREAVVRDFLQFVVPRALNISTGFVITTLNDISTQCDVLIFDPRLTPLYQEGDRQRFFPVESVFCIGEVKSDLSKRDFADALNKLAAVKALGERIAHPTLTGRQAHSPFDPVENPFDLPPSILICQRLSFSLESITKEIDGMYMPGTLHRHKHNLVLSIEDGLLGYIHQNVRVPYPHLQGHDLRHSFSSPGGDTYHHFKIFSAFMFMLTANKTLLLPEVSDYITGFDTAGAS